MDRLACDRMFVAVMELGSFSAAAQRLGTSSGQASKLVARLEEELSAQLLVRTTRALAPTETGRIYFDRVRPLLEEFDEIDEAVRSSGTEPRGRLRISAPITFGVRVLSPIFSEFARQYPKISLDVSFSDRIASLVDEGFDLALRVGTPRDSSLIARRLCSIRVATVAAPSYIAARGTPADPNDLTQHDCLLDGNFVNPYIWPLRSPATGKEQSFAVRGRLRLANAEAVAVAAEAGLGIARSPTFVSGPLIREGRLVPVLSDWETTPISLSAVYPAGRAPVMRMRMLLDFMVEQFRGDLPWDSGW